MTAKKSQQNLYEEEETAGWIYTFADLMTLLLVFFVLLFTISELEKDEFDKVMRSLNHALQGEEGANSVIDLPHEAPVKTDVPEEIEEVLPATNVADVQADKPLESEAEKQQEAVDIEWANISEQFGQQLETFKVDERVDIDDMKDGKMRIKVKGDAFFSPGSAEYNVEMMEVLDSVVLILKQNPNFKLSIHGHTDNSPIATSRFPSNWELSAIRATNVLRYMVRGGLKPERLSATGYGESVPIVPNSSATNRAKNRRLEFVLEKGK